MSSKDIKIEEITDENIKDDFKLKIAVVGDSGVEKIILLDVLFKMIFNQIQKPQ